MASITASFPPLTFVFLLAALAPGGLCAQPRAPSLLYPEMAFLYTEMALLGTNRLSDLPGFFVDWRGATTEGYTYHLTTDSPLPYHYNELEVQVDGIPLRLDAPGVQPLNLLPLHPLLLQRVVAHTRPRAQAGSLLRSGTLSLETRNPPRGLHLLTLFAAGNPVGDPGPFRYTPLRTPNVDRVGPVMAGAVSLARSGWYVRAALLSDEHHATAPPLFERVRVLYDEVKRPRLMMLGGHLAAGLDGKQRHHRLLAGFGRLRDLYFFLPLGREVPVVQHYRFAGMSGLHGDSTGQHIGYRFVLTSHDLSPRPNKEEIDFDWRTDRLQGDIKFGLSGKRIRWGAGLGLTALSLPSEAALLTSRFWTPRVFLEGSYTPNPGLRYHVLLSGAYHHGRPELPDRPGIRILFEVSWSPRPHHRLTFASGYKLEGIEEQPSPWYRTALGHPLLTRASGSYTSPPTFQDSRTLTADAEWRWQIGPLMELSVSGKIRRYLDFHGPVYEVHADPQAAGFVTNTRITSEIGGLVGGGRLEVTWSGDRLLNVRLGYSFLRPYASTSTAFTQAWEAVPHHQGQLRISLAPLGRLSLFTRIHFQSASRWPIFQRVDDQAQAHIPPYLIVDGGAQKRLWGSHLRLHLGLRNLTNAPFRTHPAGASLPLTFFVQFTSSF